MNGWFAVSISALLLLLILTTYQDRGLPQIEPPRSILDRR